MRHTARIGLLAGLFVASLGACLWIGMRAGEAHVIPPEQLHPTAKAYRDASFVLNLNPVAWEQIWPRMATLRADLARVDAQRAARFDRELAAARKVALPTDEEADRVVARKQGSRAVFQAATRAMADLVIAHLERAAAGTERRLVKASLTEARQLFAAFADVLPVTDPAAWRRLGVNWLEAATALGSPGVMGVGARPLDRRALAAQVAPIVSYLEENYASFEPEQLPWLAALPRRSRTFLAEATLPTRLPPSANINKVVPRPRQILGMAARGVDEGETTLIALGDMAFDSTYIFGKRARDLQITCNTCHNKGTVNPLFFIPGLSARPGGMDVSNSYFAPHANNGVFDHVDIPDLRGIRFTGPYGRNGRTASLREFIRNVIVLEFDGPEPDPVLLDGMVAYMNEFEFLPNEHLLRGGKLDPKTAPAAALRGEKIFHRKYRSMGDRSCASCHVPSGYFVDHKQHDIGSAKGFGKHSLDGAFDTPTLLSARYTAPYFHDGRLPTLRAVVRWFDKRFTLRLTEREIGDLTAYVETVGSGKQPYEGTPYYLDAEMEEFGFFLSTYEFLRKRGKQELINITFRTVRSEILNHKWELRDRRHLPVMDRLAELMATAERLNRAGKHAEVDKVVAAYRKLYAANVDNLK